MVETNTTFLTIFMIHLSKLFYYVRKDYYCCKELYDAFVVL